MTELMKCEDTAPSSKFVWLILAVAAAVAVNCLFLLLCSYEDISPNTNTLLITAKTSMPVSYFFALWGNKLRKFSQPSVLYTHGMLDCMEKKIFWAVGPQLIGIFLGQLAVWIPAFFYFI